MNSFIRYIGVILVIIGVLVIAIPAFTGGNSNASLIVGLLLEIVGFVFHIVLNRVAMSKEEGK